MKELPGAKPLAIQVPAKLQIIKDGKSIETIEITLQTFVYPKELGDNLKLTISGKSLYLFENQRGGSK